MPATLTRSGTGRVLSDAGSRKSARERVRAIRERRTVRKRDIGLDVIFV